MRTRRRTLGRLHAHAHAHRERSDGFVLVESVRDDLGRVRRQLRQRQP